MIKTLLLNSLLLIFSISARGIAQKDIAQLQRYQLVKK